MDILLASFTDYLVAPFRGDIDSLWFLLMAFAVLLRRMALIGDAISHSALPGIVVAFLFVKDLSSPWLLIGAAIAGLAVTILIEMIHTKTKIKQDAAIGISLIYTLIVLLVES